MNLSAGLTEQTFQILTALTDEPRHGYGIIQEVDRLTGGGVKLRVGTLYGALDRLSAEGLVAADREEVVSGRLRRYYRLTEDGVRVLTEQAERQAAQAAVTLGRLRARGTGTGPQPAHRLAAGRAKPDFIVRTTAQGGAA